VSLPDPVDLPDPGRWRERAECRGVDPATFYPQQYDVVSRAAAQVICGRCEVAEECLSTAVANRERLGIWAGTTPNQRKAMRTTAPKRCDWCHRPFTVTVAHVYYCSDACRTAARRKTFADCNARKAGRQV